MTRPWAKCQQYGRRTGCVALWECRSCRKEREEQERKMEIIEESFGSGASSSCRQDT